MPNQARGAGLTQTDLSVLAGRTHAQLLLWKSGRRAVPLATLAEGERPPPRTTSSRPYAASASRISSSAAGSPSIESASSSSVRSCRWRCHKLACLQAWQPATQQACLHTVAPMSKNASMQGIDAWSAKLGYMTLEGRSWLT